MSEQRCKHGFLRSAVPCPVCDGRPVSGHQDYDQTHTRAVSDEQIAESLKVTGSQEATALALNISSQTIRNRAKRNETVRQAMVAASHARSEAHGLVGTHRCACCGLTKPKSDFYLSRTDPRGHQSRCKRCDNDKRTQRLHRAVPPERRVGRTG